MSRQTNLRSTGLVAALLSCITIACIIAFQCRARADEAVPKAPPLPKVVSISVEPAALTLEDIRDARTVIVTGKTVDGYMVDLSPVARIEPQSGLVRVDKDGGVPQIRETQNYVSDIQSKLPKQ